MSREFAGRSLCEVEPTTLFAGLVKNLVARFLSSHNRELPGIKVVDLASGKPSRGAYEIARWKRSGPMREAAFAPAEPASATRGDRFPPEKTMSTRAAEIDFAPDFELSHGEEIWKSCNSNISVVHRSRLVISDARQNEHPIAWAPTSDRYQPAARAAHARCGNTRLYELLAARQVEADVDGRSRRSL